jgi:hypothetical protein
MSGPRRADAPIFKDDAAQRGQQRQSIKSNLTGWQQKINQPKKRPFQPQQPHVLRSHATAAGHRHASPFHIHDRTPPLATALQLRKIPGLLPESVVRETMMDRLVAVILSALIVPVAVVAVAWPYLPPHAIVIAAEPTNGAFNKFGREYAESARRQRDGSGHRSRARSRALPVPCYQRCARCAKRLGIPDYDPSKADGQIISLMKAAERLGICVGCAKSLVLKGILPARQIIPGSPWLVPVEALTSEAMRIGVQRVIARRPQFYEQYQYTNSSGFL